MNPRLILIPLCGLSRAVPKGHLRIAQRFNAGVVGELPRVPKGRLSDVTRMQSFSRPFGTRAIEAVFPALKHRAILARPFGTNLHPTAL